MAEAGHGLADLVVIHVLMIQGQADHAGVGKGFDQDDFVRRVGHGHGVEVTAERPRRGVLQHHRVGAGTAQNKGSGGKRRVAQGALAFDDDHVRLLVVECLDDGGFQFPGAKLRGHRVQCHAVTGALDQPGLPGAHQYRLEADGIEGSGEHGGGSAFADGAVGAQHGDAWAGYLMDVATEHAQKFLRAGPAHIDDVNLVGNAGGGEFRVVVKKFMQAVNDAHALAHGGQHHIALAV